MSEVDVWRFPVVEPVPRLFRSLAESVDHRQLLLFFTAQFAFSFWRDGVSQPIVAQLRSARITSLSVRLGYQGLELVWLGYGCCYCYRSSKVCPADITLRPVQVSGPREMADHTCGTQGLRSGEGQAYENRC